MWSQSLSIRTLSWGYEGIQTHRYQFIKSRKNNKTSNKKQWKRICRSKVVSKGCFSSWKKFEMYSLGDVKIEEVFGFVPGRGILIFLPIIQRTKDKIGTFGEHRAFNVYLGKMKKF